ncbi:hypothetical protein HD599_002257 [Conyzicola lurida]|uniref:FHA domain-containing protein n=1 Tax=Conyzicola lurida TaxID=1172621 RepID=A0A841ANN7_9MICO|nr:FHA domain-containing protein [Conyzicola lurida]MBB5843934.1 hypothetical protein [Conyzicola lurida]
MTSALSLTYEPASAGGWIAVVADARVLLVGGSPDQSFLVAADEVIGGTDGLQRVLDLLTSGGLSATPPFAVLDRDGDAVRVIVRGEATVVVAHRSGEETISGAGVSTWIERGIEGVTSARVVVGGATSALGFGLPLGAGAAWVSGVALGAEVAEPVEAPVLASAPVAEPVEAPEPPTTPVVTTVTTPDPDPMQELAVDVEATVTDAPVVELDDTLTGDTLFRAVPAAAPEPESDDVGLAGDHDGHTVLTSDIAKLRGRRGAGTPAATPVAPQAPAVTLVLSTGVREPLTQPILVGRSPSVSQVPGGKMPRLLTVGGTDQDISRTHVRFALEGGTVVVTDLHSRNGTTIAMPGKEPQKLRAGEPTSVIVGTIVDLGGGVTFAVEETATADGD